MIEYLELVDHVLTHGTSRQGPKPESTLTVFGAQVKYDLSKGFPLITSRDLSGSWTAMRAELLWIMSGSTNANDLHQYGSHLWDRWAKAAQEKLDMGYHNGELGPIYGHQLRNFAGKIDQLTQVEGMLKRDPQTRRAMISFWNLGDVEEPNGRHIVDVAPCIAMLHFARMAYPTADGQTVDKLDLHMIQRSADIPIGVPFDVAEWGGLFLMSIAKEVNLPPGTFTHTLSDAHIYKNQIPAMKELLKRTPNPRPWVTIKDSPTGLIYDHQVSDFELHDYHPHPKMEIPVAL